MAGESADAQRGRHRPPRAALTGWRRAGTRIAKTVAALVAVTVMVGFGYGWYNYRALESGVQRLHLANLAPAAAPTPPQGSGSGSGAPAQQAVHGTTQNILLVGIDSRAGLTAAQRRQLHVGDAASTSTDTMMILHIPADGSTATLISLPRDSYVDIRGFNKNKLNAAYADGYSYTDGDHERRTATGADLLIDTVRKLTGVHITHYVQVGFLGFYKIAQVLGTIPVTLCHDVDDSFARNRAAGLRGGSGFAMSAGKHELSPVQALEFVRQRHFLPQGDISREARQRYFIKAAFNKIVSARVLLDPGRLSRLIKAVTGSFYMDDNDGFTISDLADQLMTLTADDFVGHTIPTQGDATIPGVGDVKLVDPATVRAAVHDWLAGTPTRSTTAPASPVAPHPSTPATRTRTSHPTASPIPGCID